jgi:hypothetical protein
LVIKLFSNCTAPPNLAITVRLISSSTCLLHPAKCFLPSPDLSRIFIKHNRSRHGTKKSFCNASVFGTRTLYEHTVLYLGPLLLTSWAVIKFYSRAAPRFCTLAAAAVQKALTPKTARGSKNRQQYASLRDGELNEP